MDITERIPDLSDNELENLYANAIRLAKSGSAQQRVRAEALLPLLGQAREDRLRARESAKAELSRAAAALKAATGRRLKKSVVSSGDL